MHLAIASLGQGVPAACFPYQDKFEGLMVHFNQPESLLLSPEDALAEGRLAAFIDHFIAQLPACRATVAKLLPRVMDAAALNMAPLLRATARAVAEPALTL